MAVKRNVAGASGKPKDAYAWVAKAEQAATYEELEDDGTFQTLSAKMAAGLLRQIHGEFKRQLEVTGRKAIQ